MTNAQYGAETEVFYMPNRQQIKSRAKEVFMGRYWPYVGITLLIGAIAGIGGGIGFSGGSNMNTIKENLEALPSEVLNAIIIAAASIGTIGFFYSIFAGNVFNVGGSKIYLDGYRGRNWQFRDIVYGFTDGRYWRIVGTMALMELFVMLGVLCFFVPGIIVAFGLAQVPYILAENDSLSPMEVLRRSWEIMRGRKWNLFVFGLSFIGWTLLTALTLGVVGIFYVGPYMSLATAGYYSAISLPEQTGAYGAI